MSYHHESVIQDETHDLLLWQGLFRSVSVPFQYNHWIQLFTNTLLGHFQACKITTLFALTVNRVCRHNIVLTRILTGDVWITGPLVTLILPLLAEIRKTKWINSSVTNQTNKSIMQWETFNLPLLQNKCKGKFIFTKQTP